MTKIIRQPIFKEGDSIVYNPVTTNFHVKYSEWKVAVVNTDAQYYELERYDKKKHLPFIRQRCYRIFKPIEV